MRFTVTWRKEVEDDLARIWLTAMDQQACADAANSIDAQLNRDPYSHGKQQSDGSWVMAAGPLKGQYDIRPDDCKVEVLRMDLLDLP